MKSLLFIIPLAVTVVSCNGSGDRSVAPGNSGSEGGGTEINGTVSKILDNLNPFPSAYAQQDTEGICVPEKGNNKVSIFIINAASGEEYPACKTHLADDGSFKAKIFEELVPEGYQIKIKALLQEGVVREGVAKLGDLKGLEVDPTSTIAAPLIIKKLAAKEDFDLREYKKKVRSFFEESLGEEEFKKLPPAKIAGFKDRFENGQDDKIPAILDWFRPGEEQINSYKAFNVLSSFIKSVYENKFKVNDEGELVSKPGGLNFKMPDAMFESEKQMLAEIEKDRQLEEEKKQAEQEWLDSQKKIEDQKSAM